MVTMLSSPDLDLLRTAADHAIAYASTIDGRSAAPTGEAVAALAAFDEVLPEGPTDGRETIELLHVSAGRRRWARPGRTTSGS